MYPCRTPAGGKVAEHTVFVIDGIGAYSVCLRLVAVRDGYQHMRGQQGLQSLTALQRSAAPDCLCWQCCILTPMCINHVPAWMLSC
jgi:hypothetical protein